MKKRPKIKIGDEVRITFFDHAENSKDAIEFEAHGRVYDETRLAYKIRCWGFVHDIDRVGSSLENEHSYTIVKRAIKDIKVFK